jgi:hypothetical protein
LQLPSGFVARVRGAQPDVLIRLGRIPDALTPIIAGIMEGKEDPGTALASLEDLRNYADMVDAICASSMVEPRIVDKPAADDEIDAASLEWADKVFLVSIVGVTTQQLENFRQQQAGTMDVVDDAKGHRTRRKRDRQPAPVGE